MRRLSKLWCSVEKIPGLLAVPAVWRAECGDDFEFVRPHLRPTDMVGSTYPCPNRFGECPRKIVDYGGGEFAAICRDPYKSCETVPLSPREALLHDLDLNGLFLPVLRAASIRPEILKPRVPGVWSLGLSERRSSLNQPAFLVIAHSATAFEASVADLLIDVPGHFLLVVPTNRYRSVAVQERLQARNIGYLCLEEQIGVDETGAYFSIQPAEATTVSASSGPDSPLERSVGNVAAVAAVREYIAAKAMTLTTFGNQFNTTDRTVRRFLKSGKMRRANFEAMATSIGVTAHQLLRGELPASIMRTPRR